MLMTNQSFPKPKNEQFKIDFKSMIKMTDFKQHKHYYF
jgi:hypothetical protein